MNEKTAAYVIAQLEDKFGRKFLKDGLTKIKADLLKEPDQAMMNAGDYIILNFSTLPSPSRLLETVQMEGKKVRQTEAKEREEKWKREKGEDEHGRVDGQTFLTKQQRTEYAKDAQLLLQMRLEMGTCQEVVDGCMMMANKYPAFAQEWRAIRQEVIAQLNSRRGQEAA